MTFVAAFLIYREFYPFQQTVKLRELWWIFFTDLQLYFKELSFKTELQVRVSQPKDFAAIKIRCLLKIIKMRKYSATKYAFIKIYLSEKILKI